MEEKSESSLIKNVSIAGQVTKNEQQPEAEEVTLPKGQVDTYRIFNRLIGKSRLRLDVSMKQHYYTIKADFVLVSLVSDLKVVGSGSIRGRTHTEGFEIIEENLLSVGELPG